MKCPRCGADLSRGHRSDCLLMGQLDQIDKRDLRWFQRHPCAEDRLRVTTAAEQLAYFLGSGDVCDPVVRVVRHDYTGPKGERIRSQVKVFDVE